MPVSKSEPSPTFEERARAAPLIYRFFNAADGCAAYLSGRWEGVGIQALHTWPANVGMGLQLSCEIHATQSGGAQIHLQLRAQLIRSGLLARISAAPGAFVRWLSRLLRSRGDWQSADVARYRAALEFSLDDRRAHEFGPDYARLRADEWELTVQVLENVRAHVQLKRTDGVAPIYFSGVLRKVR